MSIKSYWVKSSVIEKIIILIYIASFIGATYNHIMDIVRGGFLPYNKFPIYLNIYWTSLTLLDPLSIVLLLINIRVGLISYFLVIFSDVVINASVNLIFTQGKDFFNIFFICQFTFLVFVIITFKKMWDIPKKELIKD